MKNIVKNALDIFVGFFHNMSLFFSKSNIQIQQAEPNFYSGGIWKTRLLLQNYGLTLLEKNKIRRLTETFWKCMWQQQDNLQSISSGIEMEPREKKKKTQNPQTTS